MEQNAAYMNQIDKVDTLSFPPSNPLNNTPSTSFLIPPLNTPFHHSHYQVYNASGGAVEPAFKIMAAYTETHTALKKLTEPVFKGLDIPVPGKMDVTSSPIIIVSEHSLSLPNLSLPNLSQPNLSLSTHSQPTFSLTPSFYPLSLYPSSHHISSHHPPSFYPSTLSHPLSTTQVFLSLI